MVDLISIGPGRRSAIDAVTVHPLSHAHGRGDQHLDDGATRYVLVAVELLTATEANANGARDRIGGHLADSGAAERECFEDHRCVCG